MLRRGGSNGGVGAVVVASKLYGVNATMIIFVFVMYCIVLLWGIVRRAYTKIIITSSPP